MTAIAAFSEEGRVWMGGDSAGVAYPNGDLTSRADEKVFFNGDFLIGFCGSFRQGQVLRHVFQPPRVPAGCPNLDAWMTTRFVDELRVCLKAAGVAQTTDGAETTDQTSSFLVAYRDRLWELHADYSLASSRDGLMGAGTGGKYAAATLYTLNRLRRAAPGASIDEPRARLEYALLVAEHFNGGVRAPFVIHHT